MGKVRGNPGDELFRNLEQTNRRLAALEKIAGRARGASVATTVAGLPASPSDGDLAWLVTGDFRTALVYDDTFSNWVSCEFLIGQAGLFTETFTSLTDVFLVNTECLMQGVKPRTDAGLLLQVKLAVRTSGDTHYGIAIYELTNPTAVGGETLRSSDLSPIHPGSGADRYYFGAWDTADAFTTANADNSLVVVRGRVSAGTGTIRMFEIGGRWIGT